MKCNDVSSGKIFIIGLPRTATTSVCLAMLGLGYKTAHNAYTQNAFIQAEVIADTPVFCDYEQLDKNFPCSRFIYLTRAADKWLPSIKQLLQRMLINLQRSDGGFNPHLKRCYHEVFSPLTLDNIAEDDFLLSCYLRHQQSITTYFQERPYDLITLDVSEDDSYARLLNFLGQGKRHTSDELNISLSNSQGFSLINMGGKVKAWQSIHNKFKVESTNNGKIDKILY